jgi:hypothetical protein
MYPGDRMNSVLRWNQRAAAVSAKADAVIGAGDVIVVDFAQ